MKYKIVLPITLVIVVSIGLICYITQSHNYSIRKLNEHANAELVDEPLSFIDLNDPEVMREQVRKMRRFELIEGNYINHLNPKEIEEELKADKLRSLAESNVFDDVVIVDPNTDSYDKIKRWFIKSMRQFSSNIILYPYAFDFTHQLGNETIDKHYEQGGFISLNPDELDGIDIGLKTNGTLSIKKARALFDADIAILNVNGDIKEENLTNIEFLYDAGDWCTYFQTFLSKGTCYRTYEKFFEAKKANSQNAYVTWINETEVKNGKLMDEGLPRFGVLIIPDYRAGSDQIILSKIGTAGINKIKEFYNNGGVILVTGKSGTLFEDFGLVVKGTYNRKKLLSINTSDRKVSTKGCEETFNQTYENGVDFKKQMICVSMKAIRKVCLSSTFLTQKLDTTFETLVSVDSTNNKLVINDYDTGFEEQLTDAQRNNLPLIMHKANEKNGQIFLMNFNPIFAGSDRNIILNTLSLALSKELYLTSNVTMNINSTEMPDMPIPAGEAGFNLEINTVIHNLNDMKISDCQLYVFLPDNFNWTDIPKTCNRTKDFTSIPISVKKKKSFNSENDYLLCNIGTVNTYEKYNFKITISVLNYKATQLKYKVTILEPIAVFTDSQNKVNTLVDYVKVNCEAASLLRVAINPDPSGFYPVKGEGQYVDNVVKIENKEQTGAFDVEYVGLIPLISPLTDGDDQRKTIWNLKIYVDYYNTINNFEVPFRSDDAQDFIYTAFLKGKGAVIVAEWDSPVLPVKETITPEKAGDISLDDEVDLKGINVGMLTINKNSEVLKQVNYRKSDRFYKLASQRLMVFIDDSTPEGTLTLHKGFQNIPKEWKDEELNDRARREFIFTRSDIYFYENENYVNPPKITEKVVLSVDKKVLYKKNKANCVSERGEARSQIISNGFFTNFDTNCRDKILEPHIYSNELFEYCDLTVINPLNEEELIQYFGENDFIRTVHYLIPNVESTITRPKQIYDFIQDNDYEGHHAVYDSIKFIYAHTLDFTIINKTCLYGGRITVDLGSYLISGSEDVTIAPDQIAVYKILYENNKIIAYFRRGLMSNEQFGKNLGLKMNIENLKDKDKKRVTKDVKLTMLIEEMKYDISYPPDYEKYFKVSSDPQTFEFKSFWSYPALEIKTRLDRTFNGYETMEPFSRYGVYIQELNHRTVYGTAETHFEKHPGIVASGSGFSMISNLGISSIPFIEYLTVGRGQVIPAGTSTSRATWKDIWGRIWHQPLRSVFPDVPPIPPPLKNFMMTTTYEILQNNQQIYEWPSDEDAKIHLHIKLLNNYPKYFEITRCQKNQIRFIPKTLNEKHDREYSAKSTVQLEDTDFSNKKDLYLRQGGYASYGTCFAEKGAIVGGESVTGNLMENIKQAILCADLTDAQKIKECEAKLANITTLHKVGATSTVTGKKWNYSPTVESYYPKGYIEDDMWDLTHIDYDNNNMDKAYKYHMDNHLPNYDNTINKPHNTIAIPIYKGLGYSITYDKNNQMSYHGTAKKGWWGDNLQNMDDTLVAGQNTCNVISVNKKPSITNWISGPLLKGSNDDSSKNVQNIIEERNKNIYVCLYNRKRPNIPYNIDKKYYTGNVVQNNIVPIIVDLEKNDTRLTNFNCTGEQYTPDNLYTLEDNLLVTPTSKDYLYFAANLRGQAKESFNVLMNLNYFDKVKYEGMIKVNEGGRFVYWNPANGPNSFLVVDDPVSIVNAKRNDIDILNNLFPTTVSTFNSVVYHSYTFRDENKINKVWPFSDYYANSYGFGDVSVSVYVGGIRKSKAVIQPNSTTYAKIIFYNNCGFDWNMKPNAIEFEVKGTKPISAYDLLYRLVHTIQSPKKYNFLKYTVDKEYQKYIKIGPSNHNEGVAPEFFDFENINVVTIRDGFKGEYNLQINVTEDFPDNLRGKPIEIKIDLNTSYFDHFPGTSTDEIKSFHSYTVKVPSVYIAVPFKNGKFAGKVLYTSAQASDLDLSLDIGVDWKTDGVKYVDKETLEKMANATQQQDAYKEMDKYWNQLKGSIDFNETILNKDIKKVSFVGIKKDYPLFPKIIQGDADIAEVTFLVKSSVAQLQAGTTEPIKNVLMKYKKWNNKPKQNKGEIPFIYATGAWISLRLTSQFVELLPNGKYVPCENQKLSHESGGYIQVNFTLQNVGNGNSYNTRYQIVIQDKIKYVSCGPGINKISSEENSDGQTILTFNLNAPINQGERKGGILYLEYDKLVESYATLTPEEINELPTQLNVAKESATIMDLTENKGENEVTQIIRTPLVFAYKKPEGASVYIDMTVSGRRSNPTVEIEPKVKSDDKNIDNIDTVSFKVSKIDYTQYSNTQASLRILEENLVTISDFGDGKKSVEDEPNVKDTSRSDHQVMYIVQMKRTDGSLVTNRILYNQKDFGISTAEVVLIIISIVFFAFSIIFGFLGYKNYKLLKEGHLEKEVGKMDRLLA
jgi:hypothetical protein